MISSLGYSVVPFSDLVHLVQSPIHLQAQAPLSHSNYRLPTQQLDSIATSSSGFKTDLPILPLEAWSVGCKLEATQDNTVPVAWLELQHMPNHNTYTVRVIKNIAQRKAKPLADWRLDRDFDNVVVSASPSVCSRPLTFPIQYSDPAEEWTDDSVAVVKLRTTKTQAGKSKVEGYQAGKFQVRVCTVCHRALLRGLRLPSRYWRRLF